MKNSKTDWAVPKIYLKQRLTSAVAPVCMAISMALPYCSPGASAPTAITDPVTFERLNVILHGRVDPNGAATAAGFVWGPTTSYGHTNYQSVGSGTSLVEISASLTGLSAGHYHYRAGAANSFGVGWGVDRTFSVGSAEISLSQTTLLASCSHGSNATSQTFEVWNSGGGSLNYTISEAVTWLSCSPSTGTSTGEHDAITVSYQTQYLTPGTYTGTITIIDPDATGSPQTVTVSLTVTPQPRLAVSPTALSPNCFRGENATSQNFQVWNSASGTLSYTVSESTSWLSCTPTSGTSTGEFDTIIVYYSTAGLAEGTYTGTITVTGEGLASPATITVTLTVNAPISIQLLDLGHHWMGYAHGPISATIEIRNSTGATWGGFRFWVAWTNATGITTGAGTAGFWKGSAYTGPGTPTYLGPHPTLAYGIDVAGISIPDGEIYRVHLTTFTGEVLDYYNLWGQPLAVVPRPILHVSRSGGGIVLSWPVSATNFRVQTCINLADPGSWATLPDVPVPVGDQNTVTIPDPGGTNFYRLKQ